jgi:hypothetical protein
MSKRTTLEAKWRPHGDEKPRIFDDDFQVITSWMANKECHRRSDGIAIAERNLVLVEGLSNPLLYHRPRGSSFLLPSVIHDLEKAGALVFTALDKVDRASVGEAIKGINTAWKSFVYPLAAMNRNKLVDSGARGRKLTEMNKRRAVVERLLALARAKERCIRYRESTTLKA